MDRYPAAHYLTWAACAAEVELDVLTGQYQIIQVDYINDTGTRSGFLKMQSQLCSLILMLFFLILTKKFNFVT